uniref:ribbon-helix-helix domain-containing protein n=1 Tax=Ningiella ruwaisensis TaxID=2364274 RepID=UPI00109F1888|nr:type II toxin-antitoxin system ParD family antitoxin [Ningiella ruwaisensis]
MSRQSITLSSPNDEWLKAQVSSQEFSSKSEVINDLIRKARKEQEELELLRAKLAKAEKSGFSSRSPDEVRREAKRRLNQNEG